MWHMTRDTWHVKRDMWHVTCLGGWTFSQNFSSLALTVCDLWYYEDLEEKDDLLTDLINDEAVCRTAPATPGLSISNEGDNRTGLATPCLFMIDSKNPAYGRQSISRPMRIVEVNLVYAKVWWSSWWQPNMVLALNLDSDGDNQTWFQS